MKNSLEIISEAIITKIYFIRGKKVMLDKDLAELYGVPTRTLNQAVKRNSERFPTDFMFQLSVSETQNLRSQFVISSWGGTRYKIFAFTEQGVAMLSSVLKSERAIQVNIQIMRIFTKMRNMIMSNSKLREEIEKMEKKYDGQFKVVFNALRELLKSAKSVEQAKHKGKIGFETK